MTNNEQPASTDTNDEVWASEDYIARYGDDRVFGPHQPRGAFASTAE